MDSFVSHARGYVAAAMEGLVIMLLTGAMLSLFARKRALDRATADR